MAFMMGLFSLSSAYAESEVKTGDVDISVKQYQILDKDLVTISFSEGSAALSSDSVKALSNFAKTTNGESKVDRYIVAAWADQGYPTKGELSRDQRKLADMRAENIKKALEASAKEKISTFEMTKKPNWIQRAFSTQSAEVKGKGLSVTNNERQLKEVGKRLEEKGGPSTAVIVAKFKSEVSTD
jgi:hypothetical protein